MGEVVDAMKAVSKTAVKSLKDYLSHTIYNMPPWRNWQTRRNWIPVPSKDCEFESHRGHTFTEYSLLRSYRQYQSCLFIKRL